MSKYKKVMHGGNVGDSIAALAPLSQLGYPIEFYINAKAHHHWRIGREQAEAFVKLLEIQPYVTSTGIVDGGYTDLDGWRRNWHHGYNLSDIHSKYLGLPHIDRNKPWLFVAEKKRIAKVIMHRSPRYHNDKFPWGEVVDRYGGDAVFVGHFEEYCCFVEQFGRISYWHTLDYLELAQVINGADLFVGNQSSPMWVAEALKKPKILECMPKGSWNWNCVFDRPNCWNVEDGKLPDSIL